MRRFAFLPSTAAGRGAQLCCTDGLQVHSKFRWDSALKVVICALAKAAAEQFSRWQFRKMRTRTNSKCKARPAGSASSLIAFAQSRVWQRWHEPMDGWKDRRRAGRAETGQIMSSEAGALSQSREHVCLQGF